MKEDFEKISKEYEERLKWFICIAMSEENHEEVEKLCKYLLKFRAFQKELNNPYNGICYC